MECTAALCAPSLSRWCRASYPALFTRCMLLAAICRAPQLPSRMHWADYLLCCYLQHAGTLLGLQPPTECATKPLTPGTLQEGFRSQGVKGSPVARYPTRSDWHTHTVCTTHMTKQGFSTIPVHAKETEAAPWDPLLSGTHPAHVTGALGCRTRLPEVPAAPWLEVHLPDQSTISTHPTRSRGST